MRALWVRRRGLGAQGEGYFRLTGFGDAEKTRLAAQKLKEAVRVL